MKIFISLLFVLTLFGCKQSVDHEIGATKLETESDTMSINEDPLKLDNEIEKIEVSFNDKDGSFRLSIYNTFLVEPDWCTESIVIYGFSIKEDKIISMWF